MLELKQQDIKEVPLSLEDPKAKVLIGSSKLEEIEQEHVQFFNDRRKAFVWKHEGMKGIDK